MQRNLYVFFVFVFLLLTAGCEKDFDVTALEGKKKLVVNCMLTSGQPVQVFLTESVSPTAEKNINPVTDARVSLFVNDSFVQILPFVFTDSAQTFGAYKLPYNAVPGSKYMIQVDHTRYDAVSATDTLPAVPVISACRLVSYASSANNYMATFKLTINDAAETSNFYRLNIYQTGRQYTTNDSGITVINDYGYGSRPEMQTLLQDTARDLNTYLLFSDKGFNGQQKEIEFLVRCIDLNQMVNGTVIIELAAVSDAHYYYYKNLEGRAEFGSGSSSKPYSNIQGGYGIFMGQSVYQNVITIK